MNINRLSHHYGGDLGPNDIWTPEEIEEAGFVFVTTPSFIHLRNDPFHPDLNHSNVYSDDADKDNKHPTIVKTIRTTSIQRLCSFGKFEGIQGVSDYYEHKDIFKPKILDWMKSQELHYVYKVLLESSPCIWEEEKNTGYPPYYNFLYAVNVREQNYQDDR